MFLGLPGPRPDPFVTSTDPDQASDLSVSNKVLSNSHPPSAFGLIYEGVIGQPRKTTSLCNPLAFWIRCRFRNTGLRIGASGSERNIYQIQNTSCGIPESIFTRPTTVAVAYLSVARRDSPLWRARRPCRLWTRCLQGVRSPHPAEPPAIFNMKGKNEVCSLLH